MELTSIRIITADLDGVIGFYERLLGRSATRPHPLFAEFRGASGTLAIGDARTAGLYGEGAIEPAANRSVILEFEVDDVDAAFAALEAPDVVLSPTTMPWGNRSAVVRDPDGNAVNLFSRPSAETEQG